jgi:hypothetical protein
VAVIFLFFYGGIETIFPKQLFKIQIRAEIGLAHKYEFAVRVRDPGEPRQKIRIVTCLKMKSCRFL